MRNTIRGNRKQSEKQRLSKRNKTYKNWRTYIHQLNPELSFVNGLDQEHFLEILQIFDKINDFEYLMFDFSKINSKQSLYEAINTFSKRHISRMDFNQIEDLSYSKKDKAIYTNDLGLSYVSSSIMSINYFPLVELKPHLNKDFYSFIEYFMKNTYDWCVNSYQYEWWAQYAAEYFSEQLNEHEVDEEDYKFINSEYYQAGKLIECIDNLKSFSKKPKVDLSKLDQDEKELYKIMDDLIHFDLQSVYDLIDIDEHIKVLDDQALDRHFFKEYPEDAIIEEYYNGSYVPTYDDYSQSGDIIQHYVEYINSLENECLWYFNLSGKAIYKKDEVIVEKPESRKMVVDRMNNVIMLNNLSKKIYGKYYKCEES